MTADLLAGHDAYRAVQELPGIGPVLGAVIVAEIGDITRFRHPEAVQHTPAGTPIRQAKDAIIARRGPQARNIAKVAAARKLLTYVYYAMRDGHVRALDTPGAPAQETR